MNALGKLLLIAVAFVLAWAVVKWLFGALLKLAVLALLVLAVLWLWRQLSTRSR